MPARSPVHTNRARHSTLIAVLGAIFGVVACADILGADFGDYGVRPHVDLDGSMGARAGAAVGGSNAGGSATRGSGGNGAAANGGTANGGTANGGAVNGGANSGGSGGTIGGGGVGTGGTRLNDASTDGAPCANQPVPPLDIYFLLDKSGSMDQGNKWGALANAVTNFLNEPANADVGVGIGYFPLTLPGAPALCCVDSDCGTFGPCVGTMSAILGCAHPFGNCQQADVCQITAYAAPAVPLALPPNHAPVVSSVQAMSPGGGTPTRPALEGSLQYVGGWALANPLRKTILVLVTDGDPTGCTTNTQQDVASIAAAAFAGPNRTETFVIGVGSSLTSLNLVALGGGTGQAHVLDANGDITAQFAVAMNAIRAAAAPCGGNPGGSGGAGGTFSSGGAGGTASGGALATGGTQNGGTAGMSQGGAGGFCTTGEKVCGGVCVRPAPSNGCTVAGCTACATPAPTGGVQACVNGQCDFACLSGYAKQGSQCVPTSGAGGGTGSGGAPATGGQAATGGASSTDAGSCQSGQKMCGGVCSFPAPTNGCGLTGCTPCPGPAPSGGVLACNSSTRTCDFVCLSGFTKQGSSCVSTTGNGGAAGAGGGTGCNVSSCSNSCIPVWEQRCCTPAGSCGCVTPTSSCN